jgi:O-acetyl-ADP-ribose deacetylase
MERFPEGRFDLLQGDITLQEVEAVVNAANESLLGGGGVDGAIHRAAGPGLLEECRSLGGCRTGQCRITGGHGLKAKWVIHTVGPVWRGGGKGEGDLLASCYRRCLDLASERGIASLAFPSISTGAYGFPLEKAAEIASREIGGFLARQTLPSKIRMVCFDAETLRVYGKAFG